MKRIALIIAAIVLAHTTESFAQYGPSAERFFGFLDRNKDGRIDGEEMNRLPGSMREAMKNLRIDSRRGISQSDFSRVFPKLMDEMRAVREKSGGSSWGRGGSSGRDYGRGGDDRGRGSYDRGRGGYDRGRDSRSSSSSSKKTVPRTTVDLPSSYEETDKNKDGQISLYEWERSKFTEFYALDTNSDGILTPRELTASSTTSSTASTSRSSSRTYASSRFTSSRNAPSSSSSSGPVKPVKYDSDSSEGKWANYIFTALDKDKDGKLTEEEWQKSSRTRRSFERYKAEPKFPIDKESFGGWVVAVQRKDRGR
jgi:Ca2+-binding EF-hand superfamily protein